VRGKDFARARERLGLTQAALAQRLGISAPTVSRIESGGEVPEKHALAMLALGVPDLPLPLRRPAPPGAPQAEEPACERVYEPEELDIVDVTDVARVLAVLVRVVRHRSQRAFEQEIDQCFERLQAPRPLPPPPLPSRGRGRFCHRCGTWC
jgi:transcriptional regulator with XRE-family HTH domain